MHSKYTKIFSYHIVIVEWYFRSSFDKLFKYEKFINLFPLKQCHAKIITTSYLYL